MTLLSPDGSLRHPEPPERPGRPAGRRVPEAGSRPPGTPLPRRWAAEIGALVPGLAVVTVAVILSTWLSRALPGVSAAVTAVACGIALTNLGGVRRSFRPGLAFASRRLLRLAIVLLGLRIALPEVLALGWRALAVIAAATGGTFLATRWIGARLGVSPRRSLLIATGVSVCGAAAVAAMHEVAGSDDDDVASAISVVVLYGSAMILVLPLLAGLLGLTSHQLGIWAGASVHEIAQVAAIGAVAGAGVLASAVVVKLARVVLLAPIVGLTSLALRRGVGGDLRNTPGAVRRPPVVPLFVLGFVAMVIVRSLGVMPAGVTRALPEVTGVLLAAALFGLGTGVNLRELARGGRSLLLGGAATAVITVISLLGVAVIG
ncbi:YeiH family protein [Streptosporangium sp. NPDC087985]|uniref:YeiH family protein n=1 Tax=Streptosporangium sp. NPDC087985 TaxID=3366196 RepID=UPI0037FA00BE